MTTDTVDLSTLAGPTIVEVRAPSCLACRVTKGGQPSRIDNQGFVLHPAAGLVLLAMGLVAGPAWPLVVIGCGAVAFGVYPLAAGRT